MLELDVELDQSEEARISSIDAEAWFTQIKFRNAVSPRHPSASWLEKNNRHKQDFVHEWMEAAVPGNSVLDAFAANGGFAFLAGRMGATRVTGIEMDEERVKAARAVADVLEREEAGPHFDFHTLDVYTLSSNLKKSYNTTISLGGLYHVADPPYVLSELAKVTDKWLILQTAQVIPLPINLAHFHVRTKDRRTEGLSSMRADHGAWYFTPSCVRAMLQHAGFDIVDDKLKLWRGRIASPWYGALATPR